jgi:hypothetical protein
MRSFIFLLFIGGSSFLAQGQIVAERPHPPQSVMVVENCRPKETWIPGHWRWEADSQQYQWVAGRCARVPRGKQYVPGHWEYDPEGWQWVPGRWQKL